MEPLGRAMTWRHVGSFHGGFINMGWDSSRPSSIGSQERERPNGGGGVAEFSSESHRDRELTEAAVFLRLLMGGNLISIKVDLIRNQYRGKLIQGVAVVNQQIWTV